METSLNLSQFRRQGAINARKTFDKTKILNKTQKRALSVIEDIGISISPDVKKLQGVSFIFIKSF